MSKICKIILSADISVSARSRAVFCWAFFMRRLSSRAGAKFYAEHFYEKSHDFCLFSTQLTLFRPKDSIGLKKDWSHVRKCQKLAKSSFQLMFLQQNKTLRNISLCTAFVLKTDQNALRGVLLAGKKLWQLICNIFSFVTNSELAIYVRNGKLFAVCTRKCPETFTFHSSKKWF